MAAEHPQSARLEKPNSLSSSSSTCNLCFRAERPQASLRQYDAVVNVNVIVMVCFHPRLGNVLMYISLPSTLERSYALGPIYSSRSLPAKLSSHG